MVQWDSGCNGRFLGRKRPFLALVGVGWSFSSTFARRPKQACTWLSRLPPNASCSARNIGAERDAVAGVTPDGVVPVAPLISTLRAVADIAELASLAPGLPHDQLGQVLEFASRGAISHD
jgi:hypothetical protein